MNSELVGKRVVLHHTNDPYTSLKSGDRGTIQHVDGLGTVHVKWDNGSHLGLVPDEDSYSIEEGQ